MLGTIFKASDAYKNELTSALADARGNKYGKNLLLIWASAVVKDKLAPEGFAEDVNGHLRSYLLRNDPNGRTGVLIFDFITKWDSDLPSIIYRRNWIGN